MKSRLGGCLRHHSEDKDEVEVIKAQTLGGSEKDKDSKDFEAIAPMHHNTQLNGYRNLYGMIATGPMKKPGMYMFEGIVTGLR